MINFTGTQFFAVKKIFFLQLFLSLQFAAQSQIVNVESLRRVNDTSRWSGYTSLSISLIKNRNRIFLGKGKVHVQYLYKKHLGLFVGDFDLKEANENRLVDRGIQHVRYNYRFRKHVAWEVFGQSQYDRISALNFRGLLGTGPRFKLTKWKDYRLYIGTLAMFEYEEIDNSAEAAIHRDFRGSLYFSFSLFPKDNISIVSTTYYQPRLDEWGDFRISNDTSIALEIFKNLSFKVGITYFYDEFPPVGIPREQYKLTNGIAYTFN